MVHDRNAVEAAPQTKIEMLREIFTSCKLYPVYTAQQGVKRLEIYWHRALQRQCRIENFYWSCRTIDFVIS